MATCQKFFGNLFIPLGRP